MKVLFGFSIVIIGLACNNTSNHQNNPNPKQDSIPVESSKDSTASVYYECPMKCDGLKSTTPGKCKLCDMELKKVSM